MAVQDSVVFGGCAAPWSCSRNQPELNQRASVPVRGPCSLIPVPADGKTTVSLRVSSTHQPASPPTIHLFTQARHLYHIAGRKHPCWTEGIESSDRLAKRPDDHSTGSPSVSRWIIVMKSGIARWSAGTPMYLVKGSSFLAESCPKVRFWKRDARFRPHNPLQHHPNHMSRIAGV